MRALFLCFAVLLLTALLMLRVVKQLRVGAGVAALLTLLELSAFGLCPLLAALDMNAEVPFEVPSGLMIFSVWAFLTAFQYLFFVLLAGLLLGCAKFPHWLVSRWKKTPFPAERWRCAGNLVNGILLVGVAAYTAVGVYNAFTLPEVREVTIELDNYPTDAKPLRVALLADIHADCVKRAPFLRGIVDRTNAQKPDAILIAGDFVDGRVSKRGKDVAELRNLRAPLGVYGVSGNHEYFSGNGEWQRFLTQQGIRMLNNEHVSLGPVVLAGVPDIFTTRLNGELQTDLAAALRGAPRHTPVVLLCHQPKFAEEAGWYGVDLVLSGHTHGGLIRGINKLFTLAAGSYIEGYYPCLYTMPYATQVYVSRGTSLWSPGGIRLGVPSEITLITLKGRENSDADNKTHESLRASSAE